MPQYLSPGVYVEEVSGGARPIAGVGTSTAGFVGLVADDVHMPAIPGRFQVGADGNPVLGADHQPVPIPYTVAEAATPHLITSWEAFKNNFGDFQAGNLTLALAVYGFFNNGGTRCWITRDSGCAGRHRIRGPRSTSSAPSTRSRSWPSRARPDAAIQAAIIDHCETAGDRFAILDGQHVDSRGPGRHQGHRQEQQLRGALLPLDRGLRPGQQGHDRVVPPSGHIAGIYARGDTERGVHKAPANEVIRGAVGVDQRLSKADQDGLNPDGINIIRLFDGNVTVWGARTLGGDANTEWKYINVRRLFLFLRESIDEGTQWVVFEPNDPGAVGQDHAQRHRVPDQRLAGRRAVRQRRRRRRSSSAAMPRPTRRRCATWARW